jgi:hypothetical protein
VREYDQKNQGQSNGAGVRVMSISNKAHRAEVADVLFNAATAVEGKVDPELSKACSFVELGSFPNAAFAEKIQGRLLKEHKIKLVK